MDFYGFFNGVYIGTDDDGFELYDREYDANDLAEVLGAFYLNGIFPYESSYFKVIPDGRLNVNVTKGQGHIEGRFFKLKEKHQITISDPAPAMNRIDRVVIRLDITKRVIEIDVLKGAPSEHPTAPKLTRTSSIYELGIADITVRNGARAISAGDIKDTRFDSNLCGVVAHALERLDIEDLRTQYEAELKDLIEKFDNIVLNQNNNIEDIVKEFEKLLSQLSEEATNDVNTTRSEFEAFVESNKKDILELLKALNEAIESEGVGGQIIAELENKQDKTFTDEINSNKYQLVFKNGELYKREVL